MIGDGTLTLLSKKILPITVVLAASMALAACSSKPSPWSESSSPWEGRTDQAAEPEPLSIEEVDPPYQVEETVEPVGYVAAQDDSALLESAAVIDEPIVEEPMSEPSETSGQMIDESSALVAVGGSLADQPAEMLAVQVVASSSMDQLNDFATQNNLSGDWVAETTVDGKVWFVLMSGVYATKSEAEAALAELQGLGTQPWIRTVGSVQAVMSQ